VISSKNIAAVFEAAQHALVSECRVKRLQQELCLLKNSRIRL